MNKKTETNTDNKDQSNDTDNQNNQNYTFKIKKHITLTAIIDQNGHENRETAYNNASMIIETILTRILSGQHDNILFNFLIDDDTINDDE